MNRKLAVLAAGGTGGHLFPAQALAEALIARGWRIVLATDERGALYADKFPAEHRIPLAAATFRNGDVLGMIGAGIGLGILFGNYLSGALRNPSAAAGERPMLFLGMALTEALGIFALVIAFIILFVPV